jgi:transcriptional regulator with XRE-family HTH domain
MTTATTRRPHALLDAAMTLLNLKNDAALARELSITAPRLSKIRNGHLPVNADLLLRIHERCEVPVATLRRLLEPQGGYARPAQPGYSAAP